MTRHVGSENGLIKRALTLLVAKLFTDRIIAISGLKINSIMAVPADNNSTQWDRFIKVRQS